MENLVTETVADQGLTLNVEDETGLISALPRNHHDEVVLEERTNGDANAVDAEASGTDIIVDLVHEIDSLTKDDARARLLELEEHQDKTFFEIGGVLSAIQKHKWFEPFGSLDEWVEKHTTIKRSRARAWIQIYDAIVKSGVTWAKVKHLGWTKLNAIAAVLDGESVDHWIETASTQNRTEIKKLMQEHLAGSGGQKRDESSPEPVKPFKFLLRDEQVKAVQAAIDRAKEIAGVPHDSAALEVICRGYMDREMTMSPGPRAAEFVAYLNHLPKITAAAVIKRVRADVSHDLNWQAD
jgi:hypothetical protein